MAVSTWKPIISPTNLQISYQQLTSAVITQTCQKNSYHRHIQILKNSTKKPWHNYPYWGRLFTSKCLLSVVCCCLSQILSQVLTRKSSYQQPQSSSQCQKFTFQLKNLQNKHILHPNHSFAQITYVCLYIFNTKLKTNIVFPWQNKVCCGQRQSLCSSFNLQGKTKLCHIIVHQCLSQALDGRYS